MSIRIAIRALAASAMLALAAGAVSAQSITYSGVDFASSGLGADFVTIYDQFNYTSIAGGPLDVSSPTSANIGLLTFVVGPNCWSCAQTPSFDTPLDFTVNGITQQIDLQYQWSSTGPVDTLSFTTPNSLSYDLGSDGTLNVSFASLFALSSSGETMTENLTANFAVTPVPEPSTYALMVAGLGAIALSIRRRRS